jgi:hypothetical protein
MNLRPRDGEYAAKPIEQGRRMGFDPYDDRSRALNRGRKSMLPEVESAAAE